MLILTLIYFLQSIPDGKEFGGGVTGAAIMLVIVLLKEYFTKMWDAKNARAAKMDDGDLQQQLQRINYAELNEKQREAIFNNAMEIVGQLRTNSNSLLAELDTERRLHRDSITGERQLRETIEENHKTLVKGLEKKIEGLTDNVEDQINLLRQIEQQYRLSMNALRVAFWTITPDGHLEGNICFFEDLTGLAAEECHNDGWFEAIEESSRELTKKRWKYWVENYATQPQFAFTFKHKITGNVIKTKVFCASIILDGQKVYKFTAQTAPLQLNDI